MIQEQIITEKNVPCSMRDGTILRCDVYRPNQAGEYPVLLTRLPYGKDDPFFSHRYLDTNRLVLAGYIVIIQDVRGRFRSDGDFFPFQYEAEDGYDTVEWAAELSYANGQVGMFGLSYYGFTQLLAAREQPPHLKAIFPTMTLNNLRSNMVFQQGVPKLASMKTWILESMVPDLLMRKFKQPEILSEKMQQWADALDDLPETYDDTVADGWPLLQQLGVAEDFFAVYQYPADDPLWQQTSILDDYKKLTYPAIHLGGWYDSLLQSTIENYESMRKESGVCQRLIIGPWTHGDFGAVQAERDFGIKASEDFLDGKEDLTNLHIRWFNHWLKNKETNVEKEAAVKLFIMGLNEWRDESEWPLARTEYCAYFFHSNGQANSRFGDGVLSTDKPSENTAADWFIHDAKQLIPTKGGQTLYRGVQTAGPQNQKHVEEREDMLVYATPPLTDAVEVTGPIKVKLWASSEANETTFTAKLVDVLPDGTAYHLTDGISREIMTTSAKKIGEATCLEIDMGATSNVFLPGHAIRVEIASSNHPQFDSVAAYDESGNELTKVKQIIQHDALMPSQIVLPIIR